MKKELLQQVLDALNESLDLVEHQYSDAEAMYRDYPSRQGKIALFKETLDEHKAAIAALESGIAQPEQPTLTMRPMESEDGIKGWYIDGPDFYCDIDRAPGEQYSIFIRHKDGTEGFAELAQPEQPAPVNPELIDVLRGGRQCDEDGSEIIMSRQACCEAADIIEGLVTGIAQPAPVAPIPALPTPWHHRILKVHPKSEPEFWPDELRIKYMADEISELRAAVTLQVTPPVAQAEPIGYIDRAAIAKLSHKCATIWPGTNEIEAVPVYLHPKDADSRDAGHPMQPILPDSQGVYRFKKNAIISFLANGRLNALAMMEFSAEDRMQVAQLIGYSVGGYGTLSYVTDESYNKAAAIADAAIKAKDAK